MLHNLPVEQQPCHVRPCATGVHVHARRVLNMQPLHRPPSLLWRPVMPMLILLCCAAAAAAAAAVTDACPAALVGNGICNPELNVDLCQYDGGDCCTETCQRTSLPESCNTCQCIDPSVTNREEVSRKITAAVDVMLGLVGIARQKLNICTLETFACKLKLLPGLGCTAYPIHNKVHTVLSSLTFYVQYPSICVSR
jgi:hypothetical protein